MPRTVLDQEKIQTTVERHCQVRTVSVQTLRLPVGVIQPLTLAVSSPAVGLSSTTARSGSAAEARRTQGPRGQCSSVNVPRDIQSSGASQRGWDGTEAISKVDRPGGPYQRDGTPKRPSHLDVTVPREPMRRPRMPPRKGGFARVPWEGGFACIPWKEAQPPDLRKRNRTSREAASKEPDGKQRMECGAYMKRLRTVGEEARSLYRVVARLFKKDAPTAGPQGLEVGPSDKE